MDCEEPREHRPILSDDELWLFARSGIVARSIEFTIPGANADVVL